MDRTLIGFSEQEMKFTDLVHIHGVTYSTAMTELNIDLKTVQALYSKLKPNWDRITPIRNKWKAKGSQGNFWDFCDWYLTSERKCRYCSVTEEELARLHDLGIENKRTKRGRTLEIDRMVSSEAYGNISNLTYSCYWCNNAKTDTFSEEEFMGIGKAIGEVWRKRLQK
jgi:hypothetical protein